MENNENFNPFNWNGEYDYTPCEPAAGTDGSAMSGGGVSSEAVNATVNNALNTAMQSIAETNADLQSLSSRVDVVENKVNALGKTNVETITAADAQNGAVSEPDKDIVLKGDVTESLTISAKSTELKDCNISNGARLKVNGGDVTLDGVVYAGDFPKKNGNSITSLNNVNDVVIKNTTFEQNVSAYNGIEIGLSGSQLPKSVIVENCNFKGTFSNIPILVFGTGDNAVITVNKCSFGKVSNVLRLSNKSGVRCTVNITNCDFTEFDSDPKYTGIVMCQNYTSINLADVAASNLFGPDKITVNIINCTIKGQKIQKPANISEVCGCNSEKQLLYVYNDKGGYAAYNADTYPVVNIQ